jgi:bifunctional non-homologous end joining protein LigD
MPKKAIKGVKAPMPASISPMLCTVARKPFNDSNYIYEVKFDGFRIVATVNKGKATLSSREQQNYTEKFKAVSEELSKLNCNAVLDGEVVALDEKGRPSFGMLQQYGNIKRPLNYYAFDILWLEGYDLTSLTLVERRSILHTIIPAENDIIKYSQEFTDGIALYDKMVELNLEGIVAKLKNSRYEQGERSKSWLKVPIHNRQEYVIGGWAESSSGRPYATLILGEYREDKLVYVHHSGSGMSNRQNVELLKRLKAMEVKNSPFVNASEVKRDTPIHWARPELVGEFEQSNIRSASGKIRHPVVLLGIREDKVPTDIQGPDSTPAGKANETLNIDGHDIALHGIERHYWHDITKADVINYYIKAFKYMRPYLHNRPLGLEIIKGAATDGGEFIRNVTGLYPEWATIFQTERKHPKAGKSATIEWLVCNGLATLVFIADLGSIDLHPWHSTTDRPNNPDYIVIDLDPSDNDFKKAVEVARAAKQYLDEAGLKAFIKTSGKTGLHILIPCSAIEYGRARSIGETICGQVHALLPDTTTLSTSIATRGNKVYVDPSQNDYADRIAATYCVRASVLPTVSTPIEWKELTSTLDATAFTIDTILARIEKKGDLFKGLFLPATRKSNDKILAGLG